MYERKLFDKKIKEIENVQSEQFLSRISSNLYSIEPYNENYFENTYILCSDSNIDSTINTYEKMNESHRIYNFNIHLNDVNNEGVATSSPCDWTC